MKNTLQMMFNAPFSIHKKSENLCINLEQIIKYGTLHGIRRYSHVYTLATLLPKPDYIDFENFSSDCDCELIYGDIGIYVINNKVEEIEILVDIEDGYIDGGNDCEVNYWEFEMVDELSLIYVLSVLSNENIDYEVTHDNVDYENCTVTIPQSGVKLNFTYDGNSDDYDLGTSFYKLESIVI